MSADPPVRRILFVELLGGLGDVAIALPALQALARSHPRACVEALSFATGAELLRHDPHVDAVHVAPEGRAREAVDRLLERGCYDLAVTTTDYDGIGAAIEAAIGARTPRAVTDLWRDPPPDARVEERFLALLIADGIVRPEAVAPARLHLIEEERVCARDLLPEGRGPFAALLLDAGMTIKRWPEARFAALGRALRDRHGLRPLVVAGADGEAAGRVARAIGDGAEPMPPLALRDLAAGLARCAVAVGADTGPLRVAALVGTPSAMLFGPSWAGRYGLGAGLSAGHVNIQARPGCPERRVDFPEQRCWYSGACPLDTGPSSCVLDIAPAEVEAALSPLLEATDGGQGGAGGSPVEPNGPDGRAAPAGTFFSASRDVRGATTSGDDGSGEAARPADGERARRRDDPPGWNDALPRVSDAGRLGAQPRCGGRQRDGAGTEAWPRDWAGVRRLLALRLDNIGDLVMAAPALRAIRLSRPDVHLGLLASPSGAQVAPLLPWIDEVTAERTLWQDLGSLPFDPAREAALVERLRAGRWDGAAILTSFSQSPHPAALACRLAGIPLVAGASDEAGEALTHRLPKGDPAAHQADRNLALVRALGFGAGDAAMALEVPPAARAAARALLGGEGGHLLLSPWASAPARQYDPPRMAHAAARLAGDHGLRVVLTGAPGDRGRGAALAERIGPAALDLTGRTSVAEAAALVETARLVLCCNSSAMHMAEALGRPAIVLFAGTELPSQWAPRRTPCRLLRRHVPCAPCHAMTCPFGHQACLDVAPARVVAAAAELLGAEAVEAGAP